MIAMVPGTRPSTVAAAAMAATISTMTERSALPHAVTHSTAQAEQERARQQWLAPGSLRAASVSAASKASTRIEGASPVQISAIIRRAHSRYSVEGPGGDEQGLSV